MRILYQRHLSKRGCASTEQKEGLEIYTKFLPLSRCFDPLHQRFLHLMQEVAPSALQKGLSHHWDSPAGLDLLLSLVDHFPPV